MLRPKAFTCSIKLSHKQLSREGSGDGAAHKLLSFGEVLVFFMLFDCILAAEWLAVLFN